MESHVRYSLFAVVSSSFPYEEKNRQKWDEAYVLVVEKHSEQMKKRRKTFLTRRRKQIHPVRK